MTAPKVVKTFQYFRIEEDGEFKGHPCYRIVNKKAGNDIGTIGWYLPWRRFILSPEIATAWSSDCLENIVGFLKELNKESKP